MTRFRHRYNRALAGVQNSLPSLKKTITSKKRHETKENTDINTGEYGHPDEARDIALEATDYAVHKVLAPKNGDDHQNSQICVLENYQAQRSGHVEFAEAWTVQRLHHPVHN